MKVAIALTLLAAIGIHSFVLPGFEPACPNTDPLDHTVHLPHPDLCNLFYRCDHGNALLEHCPGGLHFNPTLQVCDWPSNAGCKVTTPTPLSSTTQETTVANVITSTVEPPLSSCPDVDDPNFTVRLPHETNCKYYYICKSGVLVLYQCRSSQHFSPNLFICQPEEEAGCATAPSPSPDTTPTTMSTTEASEGTTTEEESTEVTTSEVTDPAISTTEASEGTTTEEDSIEVTTPEEIAPEISTTEASEGTTTEEDSIEVTTSEVTAPAISTTEASEGTTTEEVEVTTSEVTAPEISTTDASEETTTEEESTEVTTSEVTAPAISTTDANEVTTTEDASTEITTPEVTAPGTLTTSPSEVAPTDEVAPEVTIPDDITSDVTDEGSPQTTTQVEVTSPTNRCPTDGQVVRIPHETNCQYYYKCVRGNPILYQCSEGNNFNPSEQACQPKEEAGCVLAV